MLEFNENKKDKIFRFNSKKNDKKPNFAVNTYKREYEEFNFDPRQRRNKVVHINSPKTPPPFKNTNQNIISKNLVKGFFKNEKINIDLKNNFIEDSSSSEIMKKNNSYSFLHVKFLEENEDNDLKKFEF